MRLIVKQATLLIHVYILITLKSNPGTNQYWAMRVKLPGRLWWGLNSSITNIHNNKSDAHTTDLDDLIFFKLMYLLTLKDNFDGMNFEIVTCHIIKKGMLGYYKFFLSLLNHISFWWKDGTTVILSQFLQSFQFSGFFSTLTSLTCQVINNHYSKLTWTFLSYLHI